MKRVPPYPRRQTFFQLMAVAALGLCIAFVLAMLARDDVDGTLATSAAVLGVCAMLLAVGSWLGLIFGSVWRLLRDGMHRGQRPDELE